MVRAKFVCESKIIRADGETVKLSAVTHDSVENERYFKWTPFGQIEIGILNEDAAAQFEPGKEYFIDFTPAN